MVSNLPIEPAFRQGAKQIIALDLIEPRMVSAATTPSFGHFIARLINTVEQRQVELELELATARQVPVWHMRLQGENHQF